MLELGVVGAKNSGKTTLIVTLVRELIHSGYRVATIKHSAHEHALDVPGKDSYRHREAGACLTLIESKSELALYGSPDQVRKAARQMMAAACDICLVEGDRGSKRPAILLTRLIENLKGARPANAVASYGPHNYAALTVHFELDDAAGVVSFVGTLLQEAEQGR